MWCPGAGAAHPPVMLGATATSHSIPGSMVYDVVHDVKLSVVLRVFKWRHSVKAFRGSPTTEEDY